MKIGIVYAKYLLQSDFLHEANKDEVGPLVQALQRLDIELIPVIWDPSLTSSGEFQQIQEWQKLNVSMVIIRYVWFYHQHYAQFLRFLELGQKHCHWQFFNHPELIVWNTDKSYLLQLQQADTRIKIPPTIILEKSDNLLTLLNAINWSQDQVVIKPNISACGHLTEQTCLTIIRQGENQHINNLLEEIWSVPNRQVMIQPFLSAFGPQGSGEVNLVYFNGQFSHAYRKTAKTVETEGNQQANVFPITNENMIRQPIQPSLAVIEWGNLIIQTAQKITRTQHISPLIARVDYVENELQECLLTELEMIEPCLLLNSHNLQNLVTAIERASNIK